MNTGDGAAQRELERQMLRGQLFTHTGLSQHTAHLLEIEAFLYGLIDVLAANGTVSPDDLKAAVRQVRDELAAKRDTSLPAVALRPDDEAAAPPRQVDCAARLPVCKAVCCRLDFALSRREVEAGHVRWDLGRPYFIRQTPGGHCCHNEPGTGGCTVYADRPAVCRHYSCEGDTRIWKDFERMELNDEWIAGHLGAREGSPRLVDALMQPARET